MSFLKNLFTDRGRIDSLLPPLRDIAVEYQEENEFACLLEEYRALRTEIVSRLEAQQQILNYTVVLIAAALPVSSTIIEREQYTLLLLMPLVFTLMGWLLLVQENMIDVLGLYINIRLAPRMERFLDRKLQTTGPMWQWELFQHTTFYGSFARRLLQAVLGAVRYILPILPGIASILAWWLFFRFVGFYVSAVDLVLVVLDILVMVLLVVSAIALKPAKLKALSERRRQDVGQTFKETA